MVVKWGRIRLYLTELSGRKREVEEAVKRNEQKAGDKEHAAGRLEGKKDLTRLRSSPSRSLLSCESTHAPFFLDA